ncbi:MAG: UDP-N-acetylglucosamine 2-epimerase (non-hydrolyzing) [Candidatus Acetothermia bacterium]|jgi:UDP-N-acetylglucosamine 2-epimerase (non-hydrolysing)|nr:UDP-N-acetylglucosamine 2-epimerase (non-hydrolyzing) [Candidatus Acetothermia bacterium]
MRALVLFGTRPEAIKLAPVIKELKRRGRKPQVCVTAQHREMLDQVLRLFEIRPDWDLGIMRPDQSLFQITTRGLGAIEGVLEAARPELVLVQGDTTTAFVGALAAFYRKIGVGHIEAGLRSGDKLAPFPEEMNRRLADELSDWLFAPTEKAKANLLREGFPKERIFVTGNTVIDALLWMAERLKAPAAQARLERKFAELGLDPEKRLILVTAHRRESFDRLGAICQGLRLIAENNRDVELVYPVHLNPRVQGPVRRALQGLERVHLLEPLDYEAFVWLMSRAYLILTDSGGLQEEAPSLGKPVLVMRERTERPEALAAGTAKLVGLDPQEIFQEAQRLLSDPAEYAKMARAVNPFGDGHAAERIVAILEEQLS